MKSLALAELEKRIGSATRFKCSIMIVRSMVELIVMGALPRCNRYCGYGDEVCQLCPVNSSLLCFLLPLLWMYLIVRQEEWRARRVFVSQAYRIQRVRKEL